MEHYGTVQTSTALSNVLRCTTDIFLRESPGGHFYSLCNKRLKDFYLIQEKLEFCSFPETLSYTKNTGILSISTLLAESNNIP